MLPIKVRNERKKLRISSPILTRHNMYPFGWNVILMHVDGRHTINKKNGSCFVYVIQFCSIFCKTQ